MLKPASRLAETGGLTNIKRNLIKEKNSWMKIMFCPPGPGHPHVLPLVVPFKNIGFLDTQGHCQMIYNIL
jgi:hypothetical protein